jgi:hypothetical protein
MKKLLLLSILFAPSAWAQTITPASGTGLPFNTVETLTWTVPGGGPSTVLLSNSGWGNNNLGYCSNPGSNPVYNTCQITTPSTAANLYLTLVPWMASPSPQSPPFRATWWYPIGNPPAATVSHTISLGSITPPPYYDDYADPPALNPLPANTPVQTLYAYPASGSFAAGTSNLFQFAFSDNLGFADVAEVYIAFSTTASFSGNAGSCLFTAFSPGTFYLMNDAGTSWISSAGLGSLSNSQCTVSGFEEVGVGDILMVSAIVTFTNAYAQQLYIEESGASSQAVTEWQTQGTIAVTTGSGGSDIVKLTKTVMTSRGGLEIARGDMINIGAVTYKYSQSGQGYEYAYTLDNTEAATVRIGRDPGSLGKVSGSQPSGWMGGGNAWAAWKNPTRSANAVYTMVSSDLPGLQPLFIQGDVHGLVAAINGGPPPHFNPNMGTKDNGAIWEASSITHNSVTRYVIGPTFAPGVSNAEVQTRVVTWVKYGFTFLAPLMTSKTPLLTLGTLQPSTPLEHDIVACLQAVLK